MKKERNNTIELFRFIFSIGFVFGHMAIIFNRLQGHVATEATTQYALDTLAVFIIIAGFFMMKGFRKDVLLGETDDTLKLLVALENTEKVTKQPLFPTKERLYMVRVTGLEPAAS